MKTKMVYIAMALVLVFSDDIAWIEERAKILEQEPIKLGLPKKALVV